MTAPFHAPYDLDEVLSWLKAKEYRVTRPLVPRPSFSAAPPPAKLLKAAILDTETTGIDQANDSIIELGIVIVEYCPETGQAYRVLEIFDELEDPGMPIPPESTEIHGITDEMVRGKRIDDARIEALMSDVSLVIAHNARFDRGFVETRWPLFRNKSWACSYAQIPWKSEGMGSASLEFLAYRFGFYFAGHRASVDCQALLEVLQSELPDSGVKVMKVLLGTARIPEIKVWALNAPFDNKDRLKERGYRWDGERKLWNGSVPHADLSQEVDWLRGQVYANRSFKLELEKMDAYNRFTSRRGASEIVDC
ncbi:DNA polymerase III PolC-type [mine drainage metagenome]|uniref:DNA polymerase III PolC-type n=1 Tax=mine drainage metagenome TaxID=410659 RepID=A0A1J5R192_9ZZZZ